MFGYGGCCSHEFQLNYEMLGLEEDARTMKGTGASAAVFAGDTLLPLYALVSILFVLTICNTIALSTLLIKKHGHENEKKSVQKYTKLPMDPTD